LQFRILGPLEVVDGHRTIPIRAGNDRAVLALLLLHANEPLSTERMVDELWGEAPPPSASKILQSSVSRLRRELGSERIETRDHRYVIHVAPEELDALQFEELVRAGRGREGLALWRGQPLADLDGLPFAAGETRRLIELRLEALEQRIADDIAVGGHASLVGELESLTSEFPTRERLHAQLMRALYADGRQADALEVYRRVRRDLADELGLEPGPELRELEGAILRQDPTLPRPRAPEPLRLHRRRRALVVAVACVAAIAAITAYAFTRADARAVTTMPDSLAVIDPATNRLTASIPLGRGSTPGDVAVGSTGVWVTSPAEGTLIRVDPSTLTVARTFGVGGAAADVAVDGGVVWVVTGNDNTLVRVDPRSRAVREFPLPVTPTGAFAVARGAGAVWVAGDTLVKVDRLTGAVVGTARGHCCRPLDIAYGGSGVWVAQRDESIAKVGSTTLALISSQRLGDLELRVAVGYGSIWAVGRTTVPHLQSALVWRLDPTTGLPTAAAPLGQVGRGGAYIDTDAIAVGADGVWVALQEERAVYRLSPKTGLPVARIQLDREPIGIATGLGRVWVTVR
jgi:DNA-binding SARP family transcriptional activator/streptogramin lyase